MLRVERRQGCRSGFRTEKDAEIALNDVLGDLQHGTYVQPTKVTLAEYLKDEWLPAIEHTVRPTTLVGYRCIIAAHLTYGFGATTLKKLTPSAINRFYGKLLAEPRISRNKPKDEHGKKRAEPEEEPQPLAATTVRHIHALLHRALGDAVRWGKLERNPADAADPPRMSRSGANEMKSWSAKELQTFLSENRGAIVFIPCGIPWQRPACAEVRPSDYAGPTLTWRARTEPVRRSWSAKRGCPPATRCR